MDWRRAKSVLIFSFLMLNVILGYQLWTDWRERLNTSVDWTSLPRDVGVHAGEENTSGDNARIPTETPIMREFTYTFKLMGTSISDRTAISAPPETRVVFFEDELCRRWGELLRI